MPAQASGSVELAAARVSYDGYLPSNAVTVAPSAVATTARSTTRLTLVGTFFESGSISTLGSLDVAWRAAARGGRALDFRALGEVSSYSLSNPGGALLAGARFSLGNRTGGGWLSADGGATSWPARDRAVVRGDLGAWRRVRDARVRLSVAPLRVTARSVADAAIALDWNRGPLVLVGEGGYRLARSPWRLPYGTVAMRVQAGGGAQVGLSWGRAPADVLRRAPGARFAALTLRVGGRAPTPPRMPTQPAMAAAGRVAFHAVRRGGEEVILELRAPQASQVEIMADFTDWEARSLDRGRDGLWRLHARVAPGPHRYNVRVDGGAWEVPSASARASDDYGGETALVVIPDA